MDPTEKTGTSACSARPGNSYTFSSPLQDGGNLHLPARSDSVLLVNFDPGRRSEIIRGRKRLNFFAADCKSVTAASEDDLREIDFAVLDLTIIRDDLWPALRHLQSVRRHDGMPILVRAWSREFHPWPILRVVERERAQISCSPELNGALHAIDLLRDERTELRTSGPHFVITHRFWQPETFCTPGEAIANIEWLDRARAFSLPIATRPALICDYAARNLRIRGESASQMQAGISVDPFCQQHGHYADLHEHINKRLTRTAVGQNLVRIRGAITYVFREGRMNMDPDRVLIAENISGNEVRYRLKATFGWKHIEF